MLKKRTDTIPLDYFQRKTKGIEEYIKNEREFYFKFENGMDEANNNSLLIY